MGSLAWKKVLYGILIVSTTLAFCIGMNILSQKQQDDRIRSIVREMIRKAE